MDAEQQAIAGVLSAYRDAVNAADTNAVMSLYTDDAVLMAPDGPPSVGAAAVRQAYDGIFAAVGLAIEFTIAEARQLSTDWAFLRSTSSGTISIKANGATVPEGNQELFLFQKVGGGWKIARYSFSVMAAPRA